jgi:hypothetical protein
MIADRKSLLIADAIRSLIFILLASAALFGFLSGKIKKQHFLVFTALLIVIDLWTADKRYLNADRFEKPVSINKTLTPSVADAAILQDPSCYRVLNLAAPIFSDNTPTSYFHKSIGDTRSQDKKISGTDRFLPLQGMRHDTKSNYQCNYY